MRVKLRVMQGAQAGREVVIPVSEFLIGRGEECHLRPRSDAISRTHCAIVVTQNQVIVRDLGSKNGSYVNGQRVAGEQVVQAGDRFQVGPLQFEIVIEHVLGGAKRPAARDVKEVATRTAASSTDDLDIAHWLEEDDDTDTSRAVASPETRQFRIDDTSNLALDTRVDGTPDDDEMTGEATDDGATDDGATDDVATDDGATDDGATDDGATDDEQEKDGEGGKKKLSDRWKKSEPGKLPPRPVTSSRDSREAAADMLKRFFNRG